MTILNLHDRRALEAIVERMDTDAIDRCLDEGGPSVFTREVVAEELARRVLGGEGHVGSVCARRASWRVDHMVTYLPSTEERKAIQKADASVAADLQETIKLVVKTLPRAFMLYHSYEHIDVVARGAE